MAIPTNRKATAFIGFVFGNEHSIEDYGVYRTSDGSRYNTDMIPALNEKTAEVPGGNGQYYFYTRYKSRQFSVPIAFDHLTEENFYAMKKWLNGTELVILNTSLTAITASPLPCLQTVFPTTKLFTLS